MALIKDFRPESIETPALIFDQETPNDPKVTKHVTSIDGIEAITGPGFFSELLDNVENRMRREVPRIGGASIQTICETSYRQKTYLGIPLMSGYRYTLTQSRNQLLGAGHPSELSFRDIHWHVFLWVGVAVGKGREPYTVAQIFRHFRLHYANA